MMVQTGRALILTAEPPWPTNHGSRLDIWHRYVGLKNCGWNLGLAYWSPNRVEAPELRRVFDQVWQFDRPSGPYAHARRLLRLLSLPSLVTAHELTSKTFGRFAVAASAFAPDVVISEGIYTAKAGRRLADRLGVPFVVRSHNIEHAYMAVQFQLATSWRTKFSIAAARIHLEQFEIKALRESAHILEISHDSIAFWERRGIRHVSWTPTFLPHMGAPGAHGPIPWQERPYDAVYLGNLWSPNNVAAVRWLIEAVLPCVLRRSPNFKLLVAGAAPGDDLCARLLRTPNVQLMPDPADAAAVRARGRVLVNPILQGSGLNTKCVEMLFCDSPLIATRFAAEGLDPDTRRCFELQDDPEAFAAAMVRGSETPFVETLERVAARNRYGPTAAVALSQLLKRICDGHPRTVPAEL